MTGESLVREGCAWIETNLKVVPQEMKLHVGTLLAEL